MTQEEKFIIGITHGDVNSISYEVILKALSDQRILEMLTPVLYGSPKVAAYYRKVLKLPNLNLNSIKDIDSYSPKRVNIINCIDDNIRVELGKPTDQSGIASFESIRAAVKDLKDGKLSALVTGPINKHNIQLEGFNFPGHTEYLAKEFGISDVAMLMVYEKLRIGVVTGHIPLKKVSENLTKGKIVNKLRIINDSLRIDFSVQKPVIAVLSLNPHSGDDGLLGNEEKDTIIPAIQEANEMNILALGPYSSDGFFTTENFRKFDAILAMYHDQGLIPFKVLSEGQGVNFTAGLPAIRTSPAHGTAFDIVGKNTASFESFRNAIYLAIDIYKNRNLITDIVPLQKQEINLEE